jgi:hypothetical protein
VQAWRSRSFLLAILLVGYAGFAVVRDAGGRGPGWVALALLPVVLGLAWNATAPPRRAVDPLDPAVRRAARVGATGACLVAVAWTAPAGEAGFEAAANAGTALCTLAALVSLARIAPAGGLLEPPASARRLDAFVLAALLWGVGVAVPAARALLPERTTLLDPLAIDYASTAAALGSVGLVVAAAARARAARRLELGVADRAAGALALSVVALALALPCALLRVAPPDRVATAAAVLASASAVFSCASAEPTGVAHTMRTALVVVLLGGPAALAGVAIGTHVRGALGLAVLGVAVACVLVGLAARLLTGPFGPARSRWLEAIAKANEAALHPDPDVALREALATVRNLLPGETGSPALFRASPPEVLTIDRAGYLHAAPGEAPEHLYEIAEREPERTLRVEVLRSLEVRRADLRPLVAWLDARGLLAVTVVRDDEGPIGLIGIPRGRRRAPMNLEEVRSLRVLADRVGAVLGVSSALARSRSRELDLRKLADRRGDEIDRLKHLLAGEGGRHRVAAERLAQGAQTAAYSPAASMALEQCRRLGALGTPLTLLAPPGVDPVPWAAAAHLASPRRDRPLLVVFATEPAEQSLERWRDAQSSPLCLAESGTLLVVDVTALPLDVQGFLAASLAERVSPSGAAAPLDVRVAVTVPGTVDTLAATGRIAAPLADWLGDRAIPIPALASRSEDLRALALHQLSRIGARLRGEPLGIDDRALAALMEHDWPGNDVELGDVMLRAAIAAKGPRVTAEDLEAAGLRAGAARRVDAGGADVLLAAEARARPRRSRRPPG